MPHDVRHARKSRTERLSQVEDDLFLTKRRFISYMIFWEGYGSDTASESFEGRLQCSDGDHENQRGEKQIRTQDNVRIRKVTCKRTTTAATKSNRRGRDREAPEDSGRSCLQGRDRGLRRDTEAKTFEIVTTSLVIDCAATLYIRRLLGHVPSERS